MSTKAVVTWDIKTKMGIVFDLETQKVIDDKLNIQTLLCVLQKEKEKKKK